MKQTSLCPPVYSKHKLHTPPLSNEYLLSMFYTPPMQGRTHTHTHTLQAEIFILHAQAPFTSNMKRNLSVVISFSPPHLLTDCFRNIIWMFRVFFIFLTTTKTSISIKACTSFKTPDMYVLVSLSWWDTCNANTQRWASCWRVLHFN